MSDLPAPTAPCDACLSGGIIPGTPKGNTDHPEIGGLTYYLAPGNGDTTKAIVLACDLFGLGVPSPRIVADRIAEATGISVFIPDLLQGDYPPADKLILPETEHPIGHLPFLTRASIMLKMIGAIFRYVGPRFLYRHRMGVLVPLATTFVNALKGEKGITTIGLLGYCLGGQLVTLLSNVPDFPASVFVVAHPGPLSVDNFKKIRGPFALISSEEDMYFDGIRVGAIAALGEHTFPTASYDHPGTTHGFACRPDFSDPHLKQEFEKALQETIDWFKTHL